MTQIVENLSFLSKFMSVHGFFIHHSCLNELLLPKKIMYQSINGVDDVKTVVMGIANGFDSIKRRIL